MFGRPGVINTNLLACSQRGCHSVASRINNVRSRAESETYWALLAPDDYRLTRLISSYSARLVSCLCCGCSRWPIRCRSFFGRSRTGLCKRQWRNQSANQSNDCSLHSYASFLICLLPQFVTQASSGRFFCVISSSAWYCGNSSACRLHRFEWASRIR